MSMLRQSASSLSIGTSGSSGLVGLGSLAGLTGMTGSVLLASSASSDDDLAYQLKKTHAEMARINELREDIELKCKRLDKQVSELQEEKSSLVSEIDVLREKLQREDMSRNDPT